MAGWLGHVHDGLDCIVCCVWWCDRWKGDCSGRVQQWFPSNYVQEIEPDDAGDSPPLGSLQKGSIDLTGVSVGECFAARAWSTLETAMNTATQRLQTVVMFAVSCSCWWPEWQAIPVPNHQSQWQHQGDSCRVRRGMHGVGHCHTQLLHHSGTEGEEPVPEAVSWCKLWEALGVTLYETSDELWGMWWSGILVEASVNRVGWLWVNSCTVTGVACRIENKRHSDWQLVPSPLVKPHRQKTWIGSEKGLGWPWMPPPTPDKICLLHIYHTCENLLPSSLQIREKHIIERTLRIAKELSDLIVYCRPVPFEADKGM